MGVQGGGTVHTHAPAEAKHTDEHNEGGEIAGEGRGETTPHESVTSAPRRKPRYV